MTVALRNGWLVVPYEGGDTARVEIGVGNPPVWRGAFLDWVDGVRVAKIRPPEMEGSRPKVQLRVNGSVVFAGNILV